MPTQEERHQQEQEASGQVPDGRTQQTWDSQFIDQVLQPGNGTDLASHYAREYFRSANDQLRSLQDQLRTAQQLTEWALFAQMKSQIVAGITQQVTQQVIQQLKTNPQLVRQ